LLLPLVAALALGLFYIAGAQAVHQETFELDGNVVVDAGGSQDLDWASFFNASGGEITPLPTGFDATSFKKDFNNNGGTFLTNDSSTYATGSKDTLPISGWQCNLDNNVNSKIDVINAYAATYTDPTGDEILYFGLERNANTGTADVGFWFLQDAVGCTSTGAAATFTGEHKDGDLLVVSEFTGGGTVSTVNVYRWDRPGNPVGVPGSLNPTPVASGADCRGSNVDPDDDACGAANTAAITTPWLTAVKGQKPNEVANSLSTALLFEGGVNLTNSNLGGKCFNSFIGDTRSSDSLTATLFDFAGGQLGSCTSGIVTTPQTGAGGAITSVNIPIADDAGPDTISVRDRAVITVGGASTFGGTVTFSLCGPLALNSTSNCQSGGVQIGDAVPVSGSGGTATVFSDDGTNDPATLTSVGRYCWRAVYSGDASAGVPGSSDPNNATNVSECFVVNPITATLVTQASCSASPNPCLVGSTLTDTATLDGTAREPGSNGIGPGGTINATNGALAGGSIAFTAFGPNSCVTVAMAETSRSVSGDNTYPTAAQTAVGFQANAVGEYVFVATYTFPTGVNTLAPAAVSCANQPAAEKVTVTGAASLATAQRWLPNDTATITSPAGTTLAGLVDFELYNDGSCGQGGGTVQFSALDVNVQSGSGAANNRTVSTNNTTTLVVTSANDGVAWSWKVTYDDNALEDPAAKCETTTPAFTLAD
jgi:hypothetical protein